MKGLRTVSVQGGVCSYGFLPLLSVDMSVSLQKALTKDPWWKRTPVQHPGAIISGDGYCNSRVSLEQSLWRVLWSLKLLTGVNSFTGFFNWVQL